MALVGSAAYRTGADVSDVSEAPRLRAFRGLSVAESAGRDSHGSDVTFWSQTIFLFKVQRGPASKFRDSRIFIHSARLEKSSASGTELRAAAQGTTGGWLGGGERAAPTLDVQHFLRALHRIGPDETFV